MHLTCKCGVVNNIGEALSAMEPAERVRVLLQGLQGDSDRISPSLCPEELARIVKRGDPNDLEQLRQNMQTLCALLPREDIPGRVTIIESLGHLGDEQACRSLMDVAKSDQRPEIRRTAVRSLGNLFYQNYIHPFLAQAVESKLEIIRIPPGFSAYTLPEKNAYEEYEKAHNIIFAAFSSGNEDIVSCIGEVASSDSDEGVRHCAVQTLRGLKHQLAYTFLERATRDANVATCEIAEEAIVELSKAAGPFPLQPCPRPRKKRAGAWWKFWK